MLRVEGGCTVRGRLAYTQQDPWIQNASVKENILMGSPLHPQRYAAALAACAMAPDLEQLPAGDETEIGEKASRGLRCAGLQSKCWLP